MSIRPNADVKDGPTGEAQAPNEADLAEARFFELSDMLRDALAADVTEEERALWVRRIETEMNAVARELDRLLKRR